GCGCATVTRCVSTLRTLALAPRSTTPCRCTCSNASPISGTGAATTRCPSRPRGSSSRCRSIRSSPKHNCNTSSIRSPHATATEPGAGLWPGAARRIGRSRRAPMTLNVNPGPQTPVWAELATQAARLIIVPVPELFERDPRRFERFSREQAGLLMDFSRQRLDEIALAKLCQLADAVALRERIEAMWRGEHINITENRAVLHIALRQPPGAGIGGAEIEKQVMAERTRMLAFAQ